MKRRPFADPVAFDELGYLHGRQLFGEYRQVHPVAPQHVGIGPRGKFRIVHAGNASARAAVLGNLAGQNIDRLVGSHRHEQVGAVGTALHQTVSRQRIPVDRDEVACGIEFGEVIAVRTNQHDVLILDREHFGQMCTGLAVAGNDDFHNPLFMSPQK